MPYSSAYWPPFAISASCEPISTSCAPSSTTIRSAMRTVLKRCDTRIVMRPSGASRRRRDAAARRFGVALEQHVFGLGVERGGRFVEHQQQRPVAHEPARERELLPLAEADLDAARPRRPELRGEPVDQPLDHVRRAGAIDRDDDRGLDRRAAARRQRRRYGAPGTRSGRSPGTRRRAARASSSAGMRARSTPSIRMRPCVG